MVMSPVVTTPIHRALPMGAVPAILLPAVGRVTVECRGPVMMVPIIGIPSPSVVPAAAAVSMIIVGRRWTMVVAVVIVVVVVAHRSTVP